MSIKITTIYRSPLTWFVISCGGYLASFAFVARTWANSGWYLNLSIELKGLLANILASFLLFYLVAYLPDRRRRNSLKTATQKSYRSIKRELLYDIVFGSINGGRTDLSTDGDFVDNLMNPSQFRAQFGKGREANEGIYAFANFIQDHEKEFRHMIFKFKLIGRQIEFLLNNIDIGDDELLATLKRIEEYLFSLETLNLEYDGEKTLGNLIWEMFAGWSFIDGYRGFDPIEKAIDQI